MGAVKNQAVEIQDFAADELGRELKPTEMLYINEKIGELMSDSGGSTEVAAKQFVRFIKEEVEGKPSLKKYAVRGF